MPLRIPSAAIPLAPVPSSRNTVPLSAFGPWTKVSASSVTAGGLLPRPRPALFSMNVPTNPSETVVWNRTVAVVPAASALVNHHCRFVTVAAGGSVVVQVAPLLVE